MKPRLLLIEDNEQNRYLTKFLLERNGFDVLCAQNGPEGIEMADLHLPCGILLDIQLPLMDGYAVARALRQNPKLLSTPIIAVTSYAMVGDREKALEAGCTGYLEKPIDTETFASQILDWVTKSQCE